MIELVESACARVNWSDPIDRPRAVLQSARMDTHNFGLRQLRRNGPSDSRFSGVVQPQAFLSKTERVTVSSWRGCRDCFGSTTGLRNVKHSLTNLKEELLVMRLDLDEPPINNDLTNSCLGNVGRHTTKRSIVGQAGAES